MSAPQSVDGIDWHLILTVANWLGIPLMGVFAWAAKVLWTDVQVMKGSWLTRQEFDKKMDEVHAEREKKHSDNLKNFGDLHDKVNDLNTSLLKGQVEIEKRLGQVATTIAALRPQRPDGGPERRRGY